MASLALGRTDEAIAALERLPGTATTADGQNDLAVAYLRRANLTGDRQDWARACDRGLDAVRRSPNTPEFLFTYATALQGAGRRDDARAMWERYLEVDVDSPWAKEARSRLSELLGRTIQAPRRTIDVRPIDELEQTIDIGKHSLDGQLGPRIDLGFIVDRKHFPSSFWLDTSTTCSATLVGPNALLLAAHCVEPGDRIRLDVGPFREVMGTCHRHPAFVPDTQKLFNDLALCQLDSDVTATYERISNDALDSNRALVITGFGCDRADTSKTFRRAYVKIKRLPTADNPRLVVAGLANGCVANNGHVIEPCTESRPARLCDGDSGGATFLIGVPLNGGARVQVGVNSWVGVGNESGLSGLFSTEAKSFFDEWSGKGVRICGVTEGVQGCRQAP